MRVLVVEDERKLAQILASALQGEHYVVVVAPTGDDGFARANAEVFEYATREIKLAVVGSGNAEKAQVQLMIKSILKLDGRMNADAADALAAAGSRCGRLFGQALCLA